MKPHEKLEEKYQQGTKPEDQGFLKDIVLRRNYLQDLPLILLFFVTLVAGIYFTMTVEDSVQRIELFRTNGIIFRFPIPLFMLPPIVFGSLALHHLFNARYIISSDHVRSIEGLVSFKLKDIRIDYENVRGVEVDRTLYQRLFNLGTIQIGSSMHANIELTMIGIKNPNFYRNIIEKRIRLHFEKLSRNTVITRVRQEGGEETYE